jgi:hypothetical protein
MVEVAPGERVGAAVWLSEGWLVFVPSEPAHAAAITTRKMTRKAKEYTGLACDFTRGINCGRMGDARNNRVTFPNERVPGVGKLPDGGLADYLATPILFFKIPEEN